jgi:hypothetical protein
MILYVFEYKRDILFFLKNHDLSVFTGEGVRVLALSPCTQAFCLDHDIPFMDLGPIFSKQSHIDILLQNEKSISFLRESFNFYDAQGNYQSYKFSSLLYIRQFVLMYILWLTEVILNAIKQAKPDKLVCVSKNIDLQPLEKLTMREDYLSRILEKISHERNIHFEKIFCNQISCKNLLRAFFLNAFRWIWFYVSFLWLAFWKEKRKYLFCSSKHYNLGNVLERFKTKSKEWSLVYLFASKCAEEFKLLFTKNYWNFFFQFPEGISLLRRLKIKRKVRQFVKEYLAQIETQSQIFVYKGVDLSDLLFKKLENTLGNYLQNLWGQGYYIERLIKVLKPRIVISQMSLGCFALMAEISQRYSVPTVMISHGSHVKSYNQYAFKEWEEHSYGLMNTPFEYVAVQTPLAKEYCQEHNIQSKQIITGPLLFSAINDFSHKQGLKAKIVSEHVDKKILVQAGSPKPNQSFRPCVYEAIHEYIANINLLIEKTEYLKDEMHLIIRFRPTPYLMLNDFQKLLTKGSHYSVHSEGNFADYLTIADLLVSYSSTTIEEAIQSRIPVLLFDPYDLYCHVPAETLSEGSSPTLSACYHIKAAEDVSFGLRWIMDQHLKNGKDLNFLWDDFFFAKEDIVSLEEMFQ